MNSMVRPSSRRSLRNRLMICAWIDTSSEATGSSQTSTSGCMASARAIAMRWRCPPENWCGKRLAKSRIEADRVEPFRRHRRRRRARVDQPVRDRAFGDRVADPHARIERGERVLEHHLDPRRALARRRPPAITGSPAMRAVPDVGGRMPAMTRPSVDLPQPDSPTRPSDLARVDRERDAIERMHRARLDRAAERCRDALAERQARLEPLRDVLDARPGALMARASATSG